jgi:hypothetical protein
MREDSGKNPYEPHIMPATNGPARPSMEPMAPGTAARPGTMAAAEKEKKPAEQKDAFREIVETVVFVIVLVLLLKAFMAEAFVIPTGSMATTLYGYHREITCPQCGFRFPLNLSKQLDSQEAVPERVTGATCPNCRLHIDASNSEEFRVP